MVEIRSYREFILRIELIIKLRNGCLILGFFFSSLFWKFVVEENMIKRDKFVSIMDLIFFFPIDGKDQGYIIEISLESYDFSFH